MQRTKIRRLNYLCSINYNPYTFMFGKLDIDEEINKYQNIKGGQIKKYLELLALFKELKYSNDEAREYWISIYFKKKKLSDEYKKRPIFVRKDNKTYINYGSGHHHSYTIRYPKKVRKTAWKRFYKLFPHLKKEEIQ